MRWSGAPLMALLLALCACSGSPGATGSSSPGTPADGSPAAPASAPPPTASAPTSADAPRTLDVGGDRPATVRLPLEMDPDGAPLLVALHGYTSSGAGHEQYFDLGREAAARGVVVAYPDGTTDSEGNRFWNATDACCDFDRSGVADDAYLAGLITEISDRVAIDPRRVYLLGHSNGGFMAHRMACSHADLVAGIVSLAGAGYAAAADCAPSRPVAVVQIHGTADDTVLYAGGTLSDIGAPGGPVPYPGAKETVAAWLADDGCSDRLTRTNALVDVDATIDGPDGPAETTVEAAQRCEPGGAVELWTIPGGGHSPALSSAFPAAVLDFLLAHAKPAAG